jgi:hypothetical protein
VAGRFAIVKPMTTTSTPRTKTIDRTGHRSRIAAATAVAGSTVVPDRRGRISGGMPTTGRRAGRLSSPRRPALRQAVGAAAIAGTVPYLTLKVLWLSGQPVGVRRPGMLGQLEALNAVTVLLDTCVIALALALMFEWGRRLPTWLMLLPAWVGTGFLLPMAVVILPGTVLSLLGADAGMTAGVADPLQPWVRPLVYGGFAWQGVFLLTAFVLYARDRWSAELGTSGTVPGAHARAVLPLLRVLTSGAAVMVLLAVTLDLTAAARSGGWDTAVSTVAKAALQILGVLGVTALARDTGRRTAAVAAGWTGSAALFSWGLWGTVNTVASTPLSAAGYPLTGLAGLAALLGGFALAVAGLLALAGTGVARPPATVKA